MMFGKSLPEILHDAGMNEEEIEMFRKRFNRDTSNSVRFSSHIFRIETPSEELDRSLHDSPDLDFEEEAEDPKLSKLKESMKKGFMPPEEQ